MKCLIKICGITDAAYATFAAEQGADYIGMIFHAASKRNIDEDHAKQIVGALKNTHTQAVAVFVDQTADEMLNICTTLNIDHVQLHGANARQQHYLLPEALHRIYVCNVDAKGQILKDVENGLQHCKKERDFLLFDNLQPGSGKIFNWSGFKNATDFRWFLSGGLTPQNVAEGVALLHPNGVDVSSGVESSPGIKDMNLIKQFINASS